MKMMIIEAPKGHKLGPDQIDGSNELLRPEDQVTAEDWDDPITGALARVQRERESEERRKAG